VIARILLWNLFDSKTRFEELRLRLPRLEPPSAWIGNDAAERFGVIAFGDELPHGVAQARELIGDEPEVFEEFDVL
jgi:hypothetical protein